MAKAFTSILMDHATLETGRMTRGMASALRNGKMEPNMKVTSKLDTSMDLESSNGLMVQSM